MHTYRFNHRATAAAKAAIQQETDCIRVIEDLRQISSATDAVDTGFLHIGRNVLRKNLGHEMGLACRKRNFVCMLLASEDFGGKLLLRLTHKSGRELEIPMRQGRNGWVVT